MLMVPEQKLLPLCLDSAWTMLHRPWNLGPTKYAQQAVSCHSATVKESD